MSNLRVTDLDFLTTLHQAAEGCWGTGDRPSPEALVSALLAAETQAKQQHITYPFQALWGQWRLCFTTGTRKAQQGGIRLGKGLYLPSMVAAYISVDPAEKPTENGSEGMIGNQLQVGPMRLRLTGPCRYSGPKNLLAFDFTRMEIQLLGRPIYRGAIRSGKPNTPSFEQQPIKKLPFFAFFYVSDRLIAARGRGGGLALWIRETLN